MTNYGLLIDTKRCMGCRSCVASCMVENYYQRDNPWNYVLEHDVGSYPNVRRTFTPMNCMHCESPACKKACDNIGVSAISQNEYGVVLIDYEKCIGCRYCIAACPYGAPQYIDELKNLYPEGTTPTEETADSKKHPLHRKKANTVEKCTLCWHKIEQAIEEGKSPGVDQESTPSCVNVCPVRARHFGDLDDSSSEISRLIGGKRAVKLKPEYGTNPKVRYVVDGGN